MQMPPTDLWIPALFLSKNSTYIESKETSHQKLSDRAVITAPSTAHPAKHLFQFHKLQVGTTHYNLCKVLYRLQTKYPIDL